MHSRARAYGSAEPFEWERPLDPDESNAAVESAEIDDAPGVEMSDRFNDSQWSAAACRCDECVENDDAPQWGSSAPF